MSLINIPGREANKVPSVVTLTGHTLQFEYAPIGVFFETDLRSGISGDVLKTRITPLVFVINVSWIAEAGIIFCDGAVACAGEAFKIYTKSDRYGRDDRLNTAATDLPEAVNKALGDPKTRFTEFENVYFAAVRRAVAIPEETTNKLRHMLAGVHDVFSFEKVTEGEFFIPTTTEDEMTKLVLRFLKIDN